MEDRIWNFVILNPFRTFAVIAYLTLVSFICRARADSYIGNLRATSVSNSEVRLAWDGLTDTSIIANFQVYRNGIELSSTSFDAANIVEPNTYGTGIAANSLSNLPIGRVYDNQVDYQFIAEKTGAIQAVRVFFIYDHNRQGYHAGNGGIIKVELQTDDGSDQHLRTGTVLSYAIVNNPLNEYCPLLTFSAPANVEKGKYYHLVFSNIHSDRANNWVCLNGLQMGTLPPEQPKLHKDQYRTFLRYSDGTWHPRNETAIVDFKYADGTAQGMGYIEVWITQGPRNISGANAVREIINISGMSQFVSSGAIRLSRISGKSGLIVQLIDHFGNTIARDTVSSTSIGTNTWAKFSFDNATLLNKGRTYYLTLSAAADTIYSIYPIRDGSIHYKFSAESVFADGHAQATSDAITWRNWLVPWDPNLTIGTDGDLQFYFDEVGGEKKANFRTDVTNNGFIDATAIANTSYTYWVTAIDNFGNTIASSSTLDIRTPRDSEKPKPPMGLVIN